VNDDVRIIALHGFLGHPSDWDAVKPLLPGRQVDAVNLWSLLEESGTGDWDGAGEALDARLRAITGAGGGRQAEGGGTDAGGGGRPTVLLAYSFGARLALASDLLASGDASCAGACLVSCNPGLATGNTAGRQARREADEKWARLLLDAPEDDIWRAWHAQPVLATPQDAGPAGFAFRRSGLPAARETLASAMRSFSLADQPDFRPRLSRWRTPLLWVTGEGDTTFGALADGLARDGVPATFARCPGAGHRVPWDNPEGFAALFTSWLKQL